MPTIKFICEHPDIIKRTLKKNGIEKLKWFDLILKKHDEYLGLSKSGKQGQEQQKGLL